MAQATDDLLLDEGVVHANLDAVQHVAKVVRWERAQAPDASERWLCAAILDVEGEAGRYDLRLALRAGGRWSARAYSTERAADGAVAVTPLLAEKTGASTGWPTKKITGSSCTQRHVYEHGWELMERAYAARFAEQTHPRLPQMVSWSVADRVEDEARGVLSYTRTVTATADVPWMVRRATGLETMQFVQEVQVDRFRRRIDMVTKNTTWREKGVCVDETCSYYAHPAHGGWTAFEQTATLTLDLGGYGIESTLEGFLIGVYSAAIDEGRVVDEELVADVLNAGSGDRFAASGALTPWAERCPELAAAREEAEARRAEPQPEPEPEPEPEVGPAGLTPLGVA